MKNIKIATGIKTTNIDAVDMNSGNKMDGDFIEAEALGFLAIRNLLNLPISYPKTTGILPEKYAPQPSEHRHSSSCGGVFYPA